MATVATDADLVSRYLAGDQRALGDIYERYGDRIYDLCFAMLSSGDDAADAYQDTFLTAANKLGQLRDPERLRSWLYSVARNHCRARLRARKRATPDEDAGVDVGVDVDMTADMARNELQTLMAEASAGLNERDQEVLELHMRHELEGEELAEALGVSVQNAYKLAQRVRDRVEQSLGSLLVARHGRRDCPELDGLLTEWDGTFDPLWRKRINRHIEDCDVCSRRRGGLMDPGGLAGAFPLQTAPDALKAQMRATLLAPPEPRHEISRWNRDGFPAGRRRIPRFLLGVAAVGVLFVGGVAGGLTVAELLDDNSSVLETVAPPATTTTTESPTTTTEAPTTSATPASSTTTTSTTTTTTEPPDRTARTTTTTTSSTTTVPIDTTPPVINRASSGPTLVWETGPGACNATVVTITVNTTDDVGVTSVSGSWADGFGLGLTGSASFSPLGGDDWRGTVQFPEGTIPTTDIPIEFTVESFDAAGNGSGTTNAGSTLLRTCP